MRPAGALPAGAGCGTIPRMSDETHRRPNTDASADTSTDTSPDVSPEAPDVSRLTIAEAARRLDTTETAIRMRIRRGTLPSEKDASGRLYVLLADTSTDTSTDTSPTQQATRRDTSADTSTHRDAGEPIEVPYRVDGESPAPPTALVPLSTMLVELGHFADRIERLAREASEERQRRIQAEAARDELQARVDALEAQQVAADAPEFAAAARPEPVTTAGADDLEHAGHADTPDEASTGRPGVFRRWWTWIAGGGA